MVSNLPANPEVHFKLQAGDAHVRKTCTEERPLLRRECIKPCTSLIRCLSSLTRILRRHPHLRLLLAMLSVEPTDSKSQTTQGSTSSPGRSARSTTPAALPRTISVTIAQEAQGCPHHRHSGHWPLQTDSAERFGTSIGRRRHLWRHVPAATLVLWCAVSGREQVFVLIWSHLVGPGAHCRTSPWAGHRRRRQHHLSSCATTPFQSTNRSHSTKLLLFR